MFFDNDDLSNYERCKQLRSIDPSDLPFSTGREAETTDLSFLYYTIGQSLHAVRKQLWSLKPAMLSHTGETERLEAIEKELNALQNSIFQMLRAQSEGLIAEWVEKI
jgi:hypothetical protein